MIDKCPICNNSVEGYGINKRESSLLRSTYKTFGSLVSPVPFVGSYIFDKIYNIVNGDNDQYNRFVCLNCRCSWISTPNTPRTRIGGDKLCSLFFVDDSCVFGSVEQGYYMTIRDFDKSIEIATVYQSTNVTTYSNGISNCSTQSFKKIKFENGYYIGECEYGTPNGCGVMFHKNGNIWYGKWRNGMKHGVGFGCDFEGKNSIQGFWENNIQTLNL